MTRRVSRGRRGIEQPGQRDEVRGAEHVIAVHVGAGVGTVGVPGEHVGGQRAQIGQRHAAIAVHVARHRGRTGRERTDDRQQKAERRAESARAAGERTSPLADASLSHGFRPTRHQHSNVDESGQKYATRNRHAIGVVGEHATPYSIIDGEGLLHAARARW